MSADACLYSAPTPAAFAALVGAEALLGDLGPDVFLHDEGLLSPRLPIADQRFGLQAHDVGERRPRQRTEHGDISQPPQELRRERPIVSLLILKIDERFLYLSLQGVEVVRRHVWTEALLDQVLTGIRGQDEDGPVTVRLDISLIHDPPF